jgi:hypothetical protein
MDIIESFNDSKSIHEYHMKLNSRPDLIRTDAASQFILTSCRKAAVHRMWVTQLPKHRVQQTDLWRLFAVMYTR